MLLLLLLLVFTEKLTHTHTRTQMQQFASSTQACQHLAQSPYCCCCFVLYLLWMRPWAIFMGLLSGTAATILLHICATCVSANEPFNENQNIWTFDCLEERRIPTLPCVCVHLGFWDFSLFKYVFYKIFNVCVCVLFFFKGTAQPHSRRVNFIDAALNNHLQSHGTCVKVWNGFCLPPDCCFKFLRQRYLLPTEQNSS